MRPGIIFIIIVAILSLGTADEVKNELVFSPKECGERAESGDLVSMAYIGRYHGADGPIYVGSYMRGMHWRDKADQLLEETLRYLGTNSQQKKHYGIEHLQDIVLGDKQQASPIYQVWSSELSGSCEGQKRMLTIPPEKGFGDKGFWDVIPPDTTLHHTIEVVRIVKKDDIPGYNKELMEKVLKEREAQKKLKDEL